MSDDPAARNGEWIRIRSTATLTPGSLLPVSAAGLSLVLWRSAAGEIRVWEDRCPHRGTRLSAGRIRDDNVVCGQHGWRFDGSGRRVGVREAGVVEGGKDARVRTFPARVDGSGIWIRVGPGAAGP